MTELRVGAAGPATIEPLETERQRYAALLGTVFAATDTPSGRTVLQLDEVSPLRKSAGQEAFSLEFLGPATAPLGQGTHRLDHEALGPAALFLVPLGIDGSRVRYEAVFSRLIGVSAGWAGEEAGRSS